MSETTNLTQQGDLEFSHQKRYRPICDFSHINVDFAREEEHKTILLRYLKSFPVVLFTTGRVLDRKSNVYIQHICNNGYIDGDYSWSEGDIYHFEKYNIPLNKDFVSHVLAKNH